jgi:hypothetical protein
MDLVILIRMPVVTRTLTANGPWPDEQQSVSLSGYIVDQFKQYLCPELSHLPLFRFDDLWPLTMVTLRSPEQYNGQQRPQWTRSTGKRVQNEPTDGRRRIRRFNSGIPNLNKNNLGENSFRTVGGGRAYRAGPDGAKGTFIIHDLTTHRRAQNNLRQPARSFIPTRKTKGGLVL